MKALFIFIALLFLSQLAAAQWVKQTVNTNSAFRGLSVVGEKVVWASGTGGTVVRTIDGGTTWNVFKVPGAEKLDFRDIEAFDANTAYILSIGNGDSSRIYKTTDGGTTWKQQFLNENKEAFFDAIACWDRNNCIAMSDPVGGSYLLISTTDGETWKPVVSKKPAAAAVGEAAFAASGTCLIVHGKNGAFIVSGGDAARVFHSADRCVNWTVVNSPLAYGTSGSGIFSIAMFDAKNGVIVGGNYEKPAENRASLALTTDGGTMWAIGKGLGGYRSGVAYVDSKTIVAVGTNGSDMSTDGGKTWTSIDKLNYNSVQAKGKKAVWAVGPSGHVAVMK